MRHALIFSAILAATAGFASAQEWGDLEGTFIFKGTPPTPAKIAPTKDPEVCGKHPLVEEALVVNAENKGIQNVVVYLADTAKPKVHPDYAKEAAAEVALDNHNCRFEPHVQGIRVGQTLVIGNKDPIGHNTKADFFANTPFNDLIPAGGSVKKTFAKFEGQPSPISCSIHPWMNAYLLIREDPYFAISDKDGKFTIKNLPAGEHTFIVWSNKFVSKVSVGGKATEWARGRMKMNIKAGSNSLGKVEVTP
ncbi:MAG TPA: methylamine utilization protein [Pirellulaceae bacterium]|jgi:plastocyanin